MPDGGDWLDPLFRPRPLALLLAVSFALGAAHALSMLPLSLILGEGVFWDFPRGTIPGGLTDMAATLTGYRYLAAAPWMLPLLHVPNLVPPAGTDAFWLDPVPLAALLGRLAAAVTGAPVNLLGVFLFLCFALPGVAMAGLFWAAGARGLLAAAAAALLTDTMPLLLFEWGHVALCAQFLVVLALALCVASPRRPGDWRIALAWLALLAATLLIHLYLFVMVGGCWAAAMLQAGLDRRVSRARLAAEALPVIGLILGLGVATGIVSRDIRSGGTDGYGIFSLNLGSPWVSQLSGAIPPLRQYWLGMRSQVLGYPGLGVLIVLLAAVMVLAWRRPRALTIRGQAALIAVLLLFTAFAVSNRITLGAHVLLEIPLPPRLAYAFGAFRASGRFFWPVAYALTAAATLVLLRGTRHGPALTVLAVACGLQVIDAGPLRAAIADSIAHPPAAAIDRVRAAHAMAGAGGVAMFPTSGCVQQAIDDGEAPAGSAPRLSQAVVELQLLAAGGNLPLGAVTNARIATDCAAEAAARRQALRPGQAYFYLTDFVPAASQTGGRDPASVCTMLDWLRTCRMPQ